MPVDWVSGRLGLALKSALMLIEQALRSVRKVPTLLDAFLKFALRFLDLAEPLLRLRLTIHPTPPDTPKVQPRRDQRTRMLGVACICIFLSGAEAGAAEAAARRQSAGERVVPQRSE
jgi:hypothetical protein